LNRTPRFTILIPAYNEGNSVLAYLHRLNESLTLDFECLIIVDSDTDTTIASVLDFKSVNPRFDYSVNSDGPGPAMALRHGFKIAKSDVVVVTMADGSDDPKDIEKLVLLVERGVKIAAASRYMPGGQQVGAPLIKSLLSRLAGTSLRLLTRIGTHDCTNSFKAYDRDFVNQVGIESTQGFEIALELVAKAKRARAPIAEIPTIWIERVYGASNFKIRKWLPSYLKWYFHALGGKKKH
jgi:dolichol-phosphate mannosyltransferase